MGRTVGTTRPGCRPELACASRNPAPGYSPTEPVELSGRAGANKWHKRHSVSGWPGALRAPSIISAAKRRSLAQATEPFRRHLPLMLRGYRPGKRPLMRRNAGARRERRTRCVDRRGCACRPPQRSSPCGRRPQRPSSTGQQPAKQRRQSCAIAGISQRRLRARERQARARACRRPGGRARRGLAPSSRQPAAGAERGPRSRPRALCARTRRLRRACRRPAAAAGAPTAGKARRGPAA